MIKNKKLFAGIFLAMSFYILPCPSVSAEVENIEATGSYTIGDNKSENFSTAKENAYKEALRAAVERAGVYVESYSKVKNMVLTEDEIRTISGNILKITSKDFRPEVSADGHSITFICTIKATVDTDKINPQTLMDKKKLEDEVSRKDSQIRSLERLLSEDKDAKAFFLPNSEFELGGIRLGMDFDYLFYKYKDDNRVLQQLQNKSGSAVEGLSAYMLSDDKKIPGAKKKSH